MREYRVLILHSMSRMKTRPFCLHWQDNKSSGEKMIKIVLVGFLTLLLSQYNVFAQQSLNFRELSKQIQEVNSHIISIKIKLAESIIEELNSATEPKIIMSLMNIHYLTVRYGDLLEHEGIMILMYQSISEGVKLYISRMLRDNEKKKKKELGWSMESLTNYESNIKDKDIILILVQLRKWIKEAQILIDQLIIYYSSEYEKYKQDNS